MSDLAVECYSGHTYAQEPQRFTWQSVRYTIIRVEERWRTPEGPAFRVRTRPEACFLLRYLEQEERWLVETLSETVSPSPRPAKVLAFSTYQAERNTRKMQGEGADN